MSALVRRRTMMAGAAIGGGPDWANVEALLHFDGADGSTVFTDETGRVWTTHGSAQIDTAQSAFGGSSLYNGSANSGNAAKSTEVLSLPGDFTIECWGYLTANSEFSFSALATKVDTQNRQSAAHSLFEMGVEFTGAAYTPKILTFVTSAGFYNLTASQNILLNTQNHIALVRAGDALTLFVNGVGSSIAVSGVGGSGAAPLLIGASSQNSGNTYRHSWHGYVDEFRVAVGEAVYTADFTPPAAPFPNS